MATCDCALRHTNKGVCNCQDNLSWEEEKWKWEEDTDKNEEQKEIKKKKDETTK